jgi:hypothetical protein
MGRSEAALNSRRLRAARPTSVGAGALVQRVAPAVDAWARAGAGLAARARRQAPASRYACHAGGALRPLLLTTLRAHARRVRPPLAFEVVLTRFRLAALLSLLLCSILAVSLRPNHDAPVVASRNVDGAPSVEQVPDALVAVPAEAVEPTPAVTPVEVVPEPSPEAAIIALRIVQQQPIPVTLGELYQALARSAWPRELWPQVVRIAQCEAQWGSGVNASAEGDSGRALGVLQIRVDAHRELAQQFDLLTVDGALGAAWVVFQRSGYSFAPWSCA